jgi:pentapeptide MXKDX repeat protein
MSAARYRPVKKSVSSCNLFWGITSYGRPGRLRPAVLYKLQIPEGKLMKKLLMTTAMFCALATAAPVFALSPRQDQMQDQSKEDDMKKDDMKKDDMKKDKKSKKMKKDKMDKTEKMDKKDDMKKDQPQS